MATTIFTINRQVNFDRIVPTLLENLPTPTNEKDERYLQNLVRLDSIITVLTEKMNKGN